MSICLLAGAVMLALPEPSFTLEWTHSVERIRWREEWRIEGDALRLERAMVKGSGAGMEPGDGAVLSEGWWVWAPGLAPQPELFLAASGATGGGWTLCSGQDCHDLGSAPGAALRLAPCPGG
ncbi:DUF1850 domain-containing protein [Albidovulum sp.]|uniref:DUF1850 domain-containing protein n=1 Tax=Albidovulum sp. TaxID=1872424 RepID=UPI001D716005|nr:DUF1850 domain-containing protein [Paracoccaceae bacterium]HPE26156.1 DUF1850 domain-containing protein [Albidovulum sp.]MCB2122616.1 DUF1850 domain-containing protein [Paracoccaceae bacterium]MCB2138563.1 DUF1850 domain-containing protein [Paracoccaceae bacterium]MCB2143738.1 DUF1850 domain-containing protein [Paracoccaceae bacterium]